MIKMVRSSLMFSQCKTSSLPVFGALLLAIAAIYEALEVIFLLPRLLAP